jgi:hypothetical protein
MFIDRHDEPDIQDAGNEGIGLRGTIACTVGSVQHSYVTVTEGGTRAILAEERGALSLNHSPRRPTEETLHNNGNGSPPRAQF